jgi:hypothetical protein
VQFGLDGTTIICSAYPCFGFYGRNSVGLLFNVTDERYALTVTGDAAEKTLKWRGRYNWFSFGGTREDPIKAMASTINQAFDWGG